MDANAEIKNKFFLGFAIGTAILVVGVGAATARQQLQAVPVTAPTCSVVDVQTQIIATERPNMGVLEREFWQRAIARAAASYALPADVLTAKIAQESKFQGHVVSFKGAKGASQLMPMHVKNFDAFEIEANLNKGAEVLAIELKQVNGDVYRALRRYNGGPRGEAMPDTEVYAARVLSRVYLAQQAICSSRASSAR